MAESKKRTGDALPDERTEKHIRIAVDAAGEVTTISEVEANAVADDETVYAHHIESEQARDEMRAWIEACDPALLRVGEQPALYGWGLRAVATDLVADYSTWSYSRFYTLAPRQLDADRAVCAGLMPVHVMHHLASAWGSSTSICYGSYELQLLFHCLRHHLNTVDGQQRARRQALVLTRLMDLAALADDSRLGTLHHVSEVPPFCANMLAAMYYSNVALMLPQRRVGKQYAHETGERVLAEYCLAVENCKDEEYGFADLVCANLFAEHQRQTSAGDPMLVVAAKARDRVVKRFESYLGEFHRGAMQAGWVATPAPSRLCMRRKVQTVYELL